MALRDSAKALAPPWLADDSAASPSNPNGGVGGRYLYTLGMALDALIAKMEAAAHAWMPGVGTPTALPYIGSDRNIPRGLGESDADYAARLSRSFDSWQHAGQAQTVLRQILSFLGVSCRIMQVRPSNLKAIVYIDGADASQPPERALSLPSWNWGTGYGMNGTPGQTNGDDPHPLTMSTAWWRVWLVIYSVGATSWCAGAGSFGGGQVIGDATLSIGLNVPWTTINAIRTIVGQWKSAGTWYRWIVISLTADFANYSLGGNYYPQTTWADGFSITTATNADGNSVPAYVNALDDRLRYCSGIATAGNSPFPYY